MSTGKYPQKQAVAIALSNARRHPGKWAGGPQMGMATPQSWLGNMGSMGGFNPQAMMGQMGPMGQFRMPQGAPPPAAAPPMPMPVAKDPGTAPTPVTAYDPGMAGRQMTPTPVMSGVTRPMMARGGMRIHMPKASKAPKSVHVGPINSAVPGRTDQHNMAVKPGSYVFPADFVSSVGGAKGAQGNTAAGYKMLNAMFNDNPMQHGPHGNFPGQIARHQAGPGARMPGRKDGGRAEDPVDIVAAGGEYVVPPESLLRRFKSLDHAHKTLDDWVVKNREEHRKTLAKLPRPKTT